MLLSVLWDINPVIFHLGWSLEVHQRGFLYVFIGLLLICRLLMAVIKCDEWFANKYYEVINPIFGNSKRSDDWLANNYVKVILWIAVGVSILKLLVCISRNIDPILLHLGPLEVRWYGLLWAIGLYLAYLIQVKLYKNEGCPTEWTDHLFLWMTVGVIVGARLGHCWFYEWHQYGDPIQIFGWTFTYRNPYIEHPLALLKVWEGGLSSHGGAFGLIIAAILLYRKHFRATLDKQGELRERLAKGQNIAKTESLMDTSIPHSWYEGLLWVFDKLVIGVCITGCLIRLGNLMNSEIYGGPTDLPWGFIFVRDGQTVPCHPTQIYEMLYCLVGFAITWTMYWRFKAYRRLGLILGVFLEIIFFTRFVLEFIKNNQEAFESNFFLNMGQVLSIPFILWGFILIFNACRKK